MGKSAEFGLSGPFWAFWSHFSFDYDAGLLNIGAIERAIVHVREVPESFALALPATCSTTVTRRRSIVLAMGDNATGAS